MSKKLKKFKKCLHFRKHHAIINEHCWCGCSSMVEHQPSKLDTWVRFPSPAFLLPFFMKGDMLAFTAMISWGFYSAIIKKIGEWDYPTAAVTRRIYFYGMLFLIPVRMWQGVSWDVTVVLSVVILHEKMTFVSVTGALLILLGLIVSQKKINQKK